MRFIIFARLLGGVGVSTRSRAFSLSLSGVSEAVLVCSVGVPQERACVRGLHEG